MSRLNSLSITARLAALVVVTALGLVTLATVALLDARHRLMIERQLATKHVVEVALGVVSYYGGLEAAGELSREEAQSQAAAAVRELRYEGEEYFWIQDSQPVMIMHPVKPELEGTDVSGTEDPNGLRLFVEIADTVAADGAGYVNYLWPRSGEDVPQPKISYVAGYEPWDWIVGSGIYVDDIQAEVYAEMRRLGLWAGAILTVVVGIALVVSRSITGPLRRVTDVLATGDVSVRLDTGRGRTELERLAVGLNGTLDRVSGVVSDVGEVSGELDESARKLAEVTEELARSSASATERASAVATTSAEVSEGISTVAAGATQMGASISEIAGNANQGARIAAEAVETASTTNGLVSRLGESSSEIGEFLKVVTSIAEQTNLLALNATIEAARAGEAGRGFAVVASEVKELAQETTRAAEDMVSRVDALRGDADQAVGAIEQISGIIHRISEFQTSIAGAVEEQEATTGEMSRSVSDAAAGGQEIASTVQEVAAATQQQTSDLGGLRREASQLVETSARLQRAVAVFRS